MSSLLHLVAASYHHFSFLIHPCSTLHQNALKMHFCFAQCSCSNALARNDLQLICLRFGTAMPWRTPACIMWIKSRVRSVAMLRHCCACGFEVCTRTHAHTAKPSTADGKAHKCGTSACVCVCNLAWVDCCCQLRSWAVCAGCLRVLWSRCLLMWNGPPWVS